MTNAAPARTTTIADLRSACRRAERLEERLARLRRARVRPAGDSRAALAPWARAFALGDVAALERRLGWDGIEPGLAAAALGSSSDEPVAVPASDTPPWLERALAWNVVGTNLAEAGATAAGFEAVADELPFPELWRPWVSAAMSRLGAIVPELAALDRASCARVAVSLAHELARLSERAAFAQFERERIARPLGAGAYEAFVAHQLERGLLPLYLEFPVLLRQTGELMAQFVASWTELFERWRADRTLLATELGAQEPTITAVEPLASDRHAGGRRVVRLVLESGLKVVYKPRAVDAEARWAELCVWLREQGLADVPPAARALPRDGYGWMEWIERSDPEGDAAIHRWFATAGVLVALADLLGIEDLHAENLIATAAGPVPIDLELMLRPAKSARDLERGGPFATGLVARRAELARGGRIARWAGLGGGDRRPVAGSTRAWAGLGTDDLFPVAIAAADPELANLPRLGGAPVAPGEHASAIVSGYRACAQFLLARRDQLLAPGGPLDRFAGLRTRILFRPSQEYATLLDALGAPAAQRDAISAALLLEASLRPFAASSERPRLWALVAEERAALEALDLPRFEAESDSDALPLGRRDRIPGALFASGLDRLRRRFALWSEADLEAQAAELERELGESARTPAPDDTDSGVRPNVRFERAARALLGRIARRRIELGVEAPEASGTDLARRVRRTSLYDGLAGEALLLAAVPRSWRDGVVDEAAGLARAGFERAVAALADEESAPLGAMQGVGSWLWTLAWLERLAPGGRGRALAARLVGTLRPQRLAADLRLDLEGGLAGLVLGLLAAHDAWPEIGALARARDAGDRLLARGEVRSGGLAWRGEIGRPLAGFAHGASGIARALAALAVASGEPRFAAAAAGALAFERALFDPARGNWPVLLADGAAGEPRATWMTAWCHGAAGIGLARLCATRDGEEERPDLEAELDVALATTSAAGIAPNDHLCCGSAGRATVLALAGDERARREWRGRAEAIAAAMLDRAAAAGDFDLPAANDPLVAADWGMMRGRTGVAWSLAQLAGAELPGVLALESPGEAARRTGRERGDGG